jgi:hypothetical protein
VLNALFTIGRRRRYTAVMLLLAILAATATAPVEAAPPRRLEVAEQARASVRIVSGAWVTAQEIPSEALVRETRVEAADGSMSTARLVEFP